MDVVEIDPFEEAEAFFKAARKLPEEEKVLMYQDILPVVQSWSRESRGMFYISYGRLLLEAKQNLLATSLFESLLEKDLPVVTEHLFRICTLMKQASEDGLAAHRYFEAWRERSGFVFGEALGRFAEDCHLLLSQIFSSAAVDTKDSLDHLALVMLSFTGYEMKTLSRTLLEDTSPGSAVNKQWRKILKSFS